MNIYVNIILVIFGHQYLYQYFSKIFGHFVNILKIFEEFYKILHFWKIEFFWKMLKFFWNFFLFLKKIMKNMILVFL